MTNSIHITTIIPIYNGEKYIDRLWKNLTQQDYSNWDCVLVDDGSTDRTGEMIDVWISKDPRMHAIHTSNRGVSAARNAGIHYVLEKTNWSGYIHFADVDDDLVLNSYNDIINAIDLSQPDIIVFGYITQFLDDQGHSKRKSITVPDFTRLLNKNEIREQYFDYYGIRCGLCLA